MHARLDSLSTLSHRDPLYYEFNALSHLDSATYTISKRPSGNYHYEGSYRNVIVIYLVTGSSVNLNCYTNGTITFTLPYNYKRLVVYDNAYGWADATSGRTYNVNASFSCETLGINKSNNISSSSSPISLFTYNNTFYDNFSKGDKFTFNFSSSISATCSYGQTCHDVSIIFYKK